MSPDFKPKYTLLRALIIWCILLLSVYLLLPRAAQVSQNPATVNALNHIEQIAAKPHAMGTRQNTYVRDYLLRQFQALGISAQVQQAFVEYRHPTARMISPRVANVENIVAHIPSSQTQGPALALMSHYDSRIQTPGAGDAATGVATVLEAARVLVQTPNRKRDVYLIITDGEEMGLFGAQAFFRQHEWAENVGLVLNFEARGSSGPVHMFQTGPNNGALIDAFLEAVPRAGASSISNAIYQRMPNDTDFTIALERDITGLNFAILDGFPDYHSVTDSPENLSSDSVAQMVDTAIKSAVAFATSDNLPNPTPDVTVFEWLPGWDISYPYALVVVLTVLAVALTVFIVIRAFRRKTLQVKPLLWSFLFGISLVLLASNLLESGMDALRIWWMDDAVHREWYFVRHKWMFAAWCLGIITLVTALIRQVCDSQFPRLLVWTTSVVLIVVSALGDRPWMGLMVAAALLVTTWMGRRHITALSLQRAGMLLWAILAVVMTWVIPHGAYLVTLPLLICALASLSADWRQWPLHISAFMSLTLWVPFLVLVYLGLGIWAPQFLAIMIVMIIWLHATTAHPGHHPWLSGALGLVAIVLLGFALVVSPFDKRYPKPESLYVLVDGERAVWATPDIASWNAATFEQGTSRTLSHWFPGSTTVVQNAPAPMPEVQAATLQALDVSQLQSQWRLHNPDAAPRVDFYIPEDMAPTALRIDGQEIALGQPQDQYYHVRWFAPPTTATVQLKHASLTGLRLLTRFYQLPQAAPDRPEDSMPPRYGLSNQTIFMVNIQTDTDTDEADITSENL